MRLRMINDDEIAAITTLIQTAENIGSGVYGDKDIHHALEEAFYSTPAERAKDVGTQWMIDIITKTREILGGMFDCQELECQQADRNMEPIAIKEEDVQVPEPARLFSVYASIEHKGLKGEVTVHRGSNIGSIEPAKALIKKYFNKKGRKEIKKGGSNREYTLSVLDDLFTIDEIEPLLTELYPECTDVVIKSIENKSLGNYVSLTVCGYDMRQRPGGFQSVSSRDGAIALTIRWEDDQVGKPQESMPVADSEQLPF